MMFNRFGIGLDETHSYPIALYQVVNQTDLSHGRQNMIGGGSIPYDPSPGPMVQWKI
jgi:hypothetical protein